MSELATFSDEVLLGQLSDPERAAHAFDELYNRHWSRLYLIAYNRLRSREICEEIVQDFFTNLWMKRFEIKINGSFVFYMNKAVQYNIINHWQKENVRQRYLEANITKIGTDESTLETIELNELKTLLNSEVSLLPERCRQVYKMSRDEYKSNKEIATQLGISEKTVENQITKALKKLRTMIQHTILFFI